MASIHKTPQGSWQVRYRTESGHHRGKNFATEALAKSYAGSIVADQARGDWIDPASGREMFRDLRARWEESLTVTDNTADTYLSSLVVWVAPYFDDMEVGAIYRSTVSDFVAWMKNPEKQAARQWKAANGGTVETATKILRLILKRAVDERLIRENPASRPGNESTQQTEKIFLTAEQVDQLADAIAPAYRTLVLFAAWTGLRAGEIGGLRVRRLHLGGSSPHVVVAETIKEVKSRGEGCLVTGGHVKNYKIRTVPLPAFLIPLLEARVDGKDKDDYVFTSPNGGPYRHHNIYNRIYKPAAVKIGQPDLRFHDLRHTYASLLGSAGVSMQQAMANMGHSHAEMTRHYMHCFPDDRTASGVALQALRRSA